MARAGRNVLQAWIGGEPGECRRPFGTKHTRRITMALPATDSLLLLLVLDTNQLVTETAAHGVQRVAYLESETGIKPKVDHRKVRMTQVST
jgi:hypothetical protein